MKLPLANQINVFILNISLTTLKQLKNYVTYKPMFHTAEVYLVIFQSILLTINLYSHHSLKYNVVKVKHILGSTVYFPIKI